jgi:RNA-directed DNA polymerase
VSGDVHAGFCEHRGARFPPVTLLVVHCDTEEQAHRLWVEIAKRLEALGLELHPEKTKVVYCKDANRRGEAEHTSFDFLGYTFRGRLARGPRGYFMSFAPGIAPTARRALSRTIRGWHLRRRTQSDLSSIAAEINPHVRGWIGYYGAFYRSELHFLPYRIDQHVIRWVRHKFKRLRYSPVRAWAWLAAVKRREPGLFVHWQAPPPPQGRPVRAV